MRSLIAARSAKNRASLCVETEEVWGGTQPAPGRPGVRYQPPYAPAMTVTVPPSISPRVGTVGSTSAVGGYAAQISIIESTYDAPVDMTLLLPGVYMSGGLRGNARAPVRVVPWIGGEA